MGIPGRKPTPTAKKELAGNPGRRKLNQDEPRPGAERVGRRPRGLSDGAKKFWQQISGEMVELGLLTDVDLPAFVLMAEHFGIARQAARELAEGALTTNDEHGLARKHPLLQVLRDNSAAFRQYATEFGMTPSSRSRVNANPQEWHQPSLADELFGMIADDDGD